MAAANDETSEFTIPLGDIDMSLLPSHARTQGTNAFKDEVSKLFQKDFAEFGGWARIVVDDESVHVSWRPDPQAPTPMQAVLRKLQRGERDDAVRMLELLRRQQPDDVEVLANLGMALSDLGQLSRAEVYLRRAVNTDPTQVTALIAFGVALIRQGRNDQAVAVLRQAVSQEQDNPWAQRNLGGCLLNLGQLAEAEACLRQAVKLNPTDQQSVFGLAHALHLAGNEEEADALYLKVIDLDATTPIAETARNERRKMAEASFHSATPGVRPDAAMYCLDALRKFAKMETAEVQKIGFEIAVLGQRGLDISDPAQKYHLKNLPGQFSGVHLLCLMYVAFKTIAPDKDLGFDLSKEYVTAMSLHKQSG